MTRSNADIGNTGRGNVGVFVEAYETANNGTYSTIHVRGGYYYDASAGSVSASTAYISLSGRGACSVPYTIPAGYDSVLDEYDTTIAHGSDGSAGSGSFSCYGYTTFPSGDATAVVSIGTSANPRYGVNYDGAGGSTPGGQTKIYGINLALNGSTSRAGYTFQYWSGSDGKKYSPGSVFTGNYALTLTAVWSINTWPVSFNANGGTNAPGNQTKTYGQTLTITSAVPTRALYDFVSWAGSDGTTYNPGSQFTGNYALTLTANWKLAYIAPTIKRLQAYHSLQDGTESDEGGYIHVIVEWSIDRTIYSDNEGSGVLVKCDGTEIGTISISGTEGTAELIFGGSYDYDKSQTVSVYVYDTKQPIFGTSNSLLAQGTAYFMDFDTNGNVCFGGAAESDYKLCLKSGGTIIWHN